VSTAARLLDRLERVKATGPNRWIGCCPAHEDKSPSLSIREVESRILVHCFGGCEVGDVLGALGLQLSDLFDEPLAQQASPTHSRIPAADILQALDHEILVSVVILDEVVRKRAISEGQMSRLGVAASRIGAARDMSRPAKAAAHA